MIALRQYQRDINNAIYKELFINNKNSVIMQSATGSGKTITFISFAKYFQEKFNKKVLIITHRKELLIQTKNVLNEDCFFIADGTKHINYYKNYYLAMAESLSRRANKIDWSIFGLIIIDEAHIGNFTKLFPFFEPTTKLIGATATPITNKPLSLLYNDIVCGIEPEKLIELKNLVPSKNFVFNTQKIKDAKFKITAGEYNEKEQFELLSQEYYVKNVVKEYIRLANGLKAIIFNVNIKHSKLVTEEFKRQGFDIKEFYGDTDNIERELIKKWFKETPNAIISSVGVLTTGFDEPSIECVILNRATTSLALYLQMVGRGTRPFNDKKEIIVLDFGNNVQMFDVYEASRDWNSYFLNGKINKKNGDGVAPVKECSSCNALIPARATICKYCNAIQVSLADVKYDPKEVLLHEFTRNTNDNIQYAVKNNHNPYSVLFKTANALKANNKITIDEKKQIALAELKNWCKYFKKKNNEWHRNFIINILENNETNKKAPDKEIISNTTLFDTNFNNITTFEL